MSNTVDEVNYAIVEISGRQFWIEASKWYDVNRIPTEVRKEIILNRVLLVSGNDGSRAFKESSNSLTSNNTNGHVRFGTPYLDEVKVKAKILKHLRGPKTIVYKMRPKKKTRKKQGHRQNLTRIHIESIDILNSTRSAS